MNLFSWISWIGLKTLDNHNEQIKLFKKLTLLDKSLFWYFIISNREKAVIHSFVFIKRPADLFEVLLWTTLRKWHCNSLDRDWKQCCQLYYNWLKIVLGNLKIFKTWIFELWTLSRFFSQFFLRNDYNLDIKSWKHWSVLKKEKIHSFFNFNQFSKCGH